MLELIGALRAAPVADGEEVLAFIESRRLTGGGLGSIDVHLLAPPTLSSLPLRTPDKRLSAAARESFAGIPRNPLLDGGETRSTECPPGVIGRA